MNCPKPPYPIRDVRPYQLLCAICRLGEEVPKAAGDKIDELLSSVAKTPDMPFALKCNVGDLYTYQDPGHADDTPEGAEFNAKRDLDVLHRLNLPPGVTLPARALFHRVMDTIEDVEGICAFPSVTSDAWKGCPKAAMGFYKKGRARGVTAIIRPRDEEMMKRDKQASLAAMCAADVIRVRPHILLCSVCQVGNGVKPPYPPDNLPEMVELILKKPDTLIAMAPCADWMMCAPCPDRCPDMNACVTHRGAGGLTNQLRDLRVLQKLGLTFGSTMKARELYKLIFERFPGTLEVCFLDRTYPSVWWDPCGVTSVSPEAYEKGKQILTAALLK